MLDHVITLRPGSGIGVANTLQSDHNNNEARRHVIFSRKYHTNNTMLR